MWALGPRPTTQGDLAAAHQDWTGADVNRPRDCHLVLTKDDASGTRSTTTTTATATTTTATTTTTITTTTKAITTPPAQP